jgi:tRNA (guanine-N1)-methyltransferase
LLSPQGKPLTQTLAAELAKCEQLVLICGRYEGVDERLLKRSLLTNFDRRLCFVRGEPAALVVIDAVVRLIPGRWEAKRRRRPNRSQMVCSTIRTTRGRLILKV